MKSWSVVPRRLWKGPHTQSKERGQRTSYGTRWLRPSGVRRKGRPPTGRASAVEGEPGCPAAGFPRSVVPPVRRQGTWRPKRPGWRRRPGPFRPPPEGRNPRGGGPRQRPGQALSVREHPVAASRERLIAGSGGARRGHGPATDEKGRCPPHPSPIPRLWFPAPPRSPLAPSRSSPSAWPIPKRDEAGPDREASQGLSYIILRPSPPAHGRSIPLPCPSPGVYISVIEP